MTKRSNACLCVCVCVYVVLLYVCGYSERDRGQDTGGAQQSGTVQSPPVASTKTLTGNSTAAQCESQFYPNLRPTSLQNYDTNDDVVWWFICHENRLVEWVLVCEGGWLKWEVGSYVTGSEVRWREGGTSGSGVHFPLFPVFCFVSAR